MRRGDGKFYSLFPIEEEYYRLEGELSRFYHWQPSEIESFDDKELMARYEMASVIANKEQDEVK